MGKLRHMGEIDLPKAHRVTKWRSWDLTRVCL